MTTDGRDYLAEMDTRITDATAGSGWAAPLVAQKLHAELVADDPDLLDGWLHAVAGEALRQAIANRSRAHRTYARRAASRAFAQAARDAEDSGDAAPLLGLFAVDYVVAADRTRKRARDMTGPDHRFVAGRYEASGNGELMLAAFHHAIAEKVGDRRTAEVYTEAEYEALYLSVTRRAA